jgi:hypothetical protein
VIAEEGRGLGANKWTVKEALGLKYYNRPNGVVKTIKPFAHP